MADFDNVRFPPKISLGALGGPQFKTGISEMWSGKEGRVQWWEKERGMWQVSHHGKRPEAATILLSFFRCVGQGAANTFRFKDWTDYVCAVGEGFFVETDTSPTQKKMVKRYTFYGIDGTPYTYDRPITKPVNGAITYDGTGLNYATGIASTGTTWSGEFDCWCRLGGDWMRGLTHFPTEGGFLVSFDDIEIVEVNFEEAMEL